MYRINKKFKKINVLYEKNGDSMKAHVLANFPDEYKHVCTILNMNPKYSNEDYKKHIRNYWYRELGGKESIKNGTTGTDRTMCTVIGEDSEKALNTMTSSTRFPFRCQKCGKKGHQAKDCRTPINKRQIFTGNCNYCRKKGHCHTSGMVG